MEIRKWFNTREDGALEITLENMETREELHAVIYDEEIHDATKSGAYIETEYDDLNGPVESVAQVAKIIDELENRLK